MTSISQKNLCLGTDKQCSKDSRGVGQSKGWRGYVPPEEKIRWILSFTEKHKKVAPKGLFIKDKIGITKAWKELFPNDPEERIQIIDI